MSTLRVIPQYVEKIAVLQLKLIGYCYDDGIKNIHSSVDGIIQFPSSKKQNATVKPVSFFLTEKLPHAGIMRIDDFSQVN